MGNIRLHPKYGVNPSVMLCFFCGGDKGVAMLGANGGKEAPRQAVYDYEPCDKCVEKFKLGVVLMEANMVDGRTVPTGAYMIMKDEAIPKMFHEPAVSQIMAQRRAFLDPDTFRMILPKKDGE